MAITNASKLAGYVGAAITADGASGIVIAKQFVGDGSTLTGIATVATVATNANGLNAGATGSDLNLSGIVTATSFDGDLTGTATTATNLNNQAASYYLNYNNFTNTPTIPTNNNQLTNGAGYITGYTVTSSDVTAHQGNITITESQISDFGTYATTASLATVATSGSYNDLSNKPTIPTNNNQLTNGAGYITGTTTSDLNVYGVTVGRGTGAVNTNTVVGNNALASNTTGYSNNANGYQALLSNTTGFNNTANGHQSLRGNTTGYKNVANGDIALRSNTTGFSNTANGFAALYSNTNGNYNTANGYEALYSNTSASSNVANGYQALRANNNGGLNTANGRSALTANTSGSYNVANGSFALQSNTTGQYNAANGYQALRANTTGVYNSASGAYALYNNTTGSGNVCLGSLNNSGTYAPVFDCTTQDNRVVVGSTSVTNAYIQVAWTVVSDARDKTNFGVVPHGLEFVKQLNPVSFQFKETRDGTEPHGPVRYGFKAQDILALEGEDNAVIIDNEDPDKLRYNGEALVPVLVNAIKELAAENAALKARLDAAGI